MLFFVEARREVSRGFLVAIRDSPYEFAVGERAAMSKNGILSECDAKRFQLRANRWTYNLLMTRPLR